MFAVALIEKGEVILEEIPFISTGHRERATGPYKLYQECDAHHGQLFQNLNRYAHHVEIEEAKKLLRQDDTCTPMRHVLIT